MEFALMSTLKEAASGRNSLNVESMKFVAACLNIPISRVAEVATFYSDFFGCLDGEEALCFAKGGLAIDVACEQAAAICVTSAMKAFPDVF